MQYFNALSAGDVDATVGFIAEDGDFRTPMGAMSGRDPIRAYLGAFDAAFPEAQYDVATVVESGGAVAVEGTYGATHQGPIPLPDGSTIPATGRTVRQPFVTMFDVADGSIVSHRPYWDLASFMAQLTG